MDPTDNGPDSLAPVGFKCISKPDADVRTFSVYGFSSSVVNGVLGPFDHTLVSVRKHGACLALLSPLY